MLKVIKIILVSLIITSSCAQTLRLIHSDVLESIDGGKVLILTGNVHLRYKTQDIRSDKARWLKEKDLVILFDSVVVTDTNYTIKADTVKFRRKARRALASGNIVFTTEKGRVIVYGDKGFYDGKKDIISVTAKPHLFWIDTSGAKIELRSRILIHLVGEKISKAFDSVYALIIPKDTNKAPIKIFCDSLEFYQKEDVVNFFGSVVVKQESLTLKSSAGTFFRKGDSMIFAGDVRVIDPHWRLWADTLTVKLKSEEIRYARAIGAPHGVWHDPKDSLRLTEDSRFSSDKMAFTISNGRLTRADLIGGARIEYYPAPKDTAVREMHEAVADSIVAMFPAGRIDSVELWRGVIGTSKKFERGKIDSISYSGDMLALSRSRRIHLYGTNPKAFVRYHDLILSAAQIHFDGENDTLMATFLRLPDSDSLIGEPFLREGNDSLVARKIVYNVKNRRGKLYYGHTGTEKGYFWGDYGAKASGDTFYIENAKFTTCELNPPHYHFFAWQLKLIPRDKAIARPVIMYVGEIPVFWLPFMVFSVRKERHSGLLNINVGKFQKGERFVRNLGYYWAPSQYWDMLIALDVDEKSGVVLKSGVNYALRYHFSGNLYASYSISSRRDWYEGIDRKKHWEIRASHNQTLSRRARLVANISMASDASFIWRTHEELEARTNKSLRSYAAYSQGFGGGSFNLSWERTHDLINNVVTSYLPKLSFRLYSRPIFGDGESWFHKIYGDLSILAVGYSRKDAVAVERHKGARFSGRISAPITFGDYLKLTNSLNLEATVIDRARDGEKFPFIASYSLSVGAATDLYGNIPLNVGAVRFFHHIVSPKISFFYSPEVKGAERFYSFGGISAPYSSKRAGISFSLSQQFGLKVADTTETIRRVHLFTMSSSGSYDFLAEYRKLSDLSTAINARPTSWFSITVSMTHSFYKSAASMKPDAFAIKNINANSSARFTFGIPFKKPMSGRVSVSHYLSRNLETNSTTHWFRASAQVPVTPKWQFSYSLYYDLKNMTKISDEVRITRDLHCWELYFVWVPSGISAGYYVRLSVKKLPEIKIERTVGAVRWR